jgi:hypothetical protein
MDKCEAGKQWFRGLVKIQSVLSLRKSEPASVVRTMGFNKFSLTKLYDLVDEYQSAPVAAMKVAFQPTLTHIPMLLL